MSTFQSMKFQDEQSFIDFTESFNGNMIRAYVRSGSTGYVDFNRKQLLELRKWINIQLQKMPLKK